MVFYYTDANNHYRLVLNAETNTRSLVKVQDGVETVLASEVGGYRFNADMALKVAVVDGQITAFVDNHVLFGGPVTDATDPLTQGTVGLYSDKQRASIFDNVTVNEIDLDAHAGNDQRLVDLDGDGSVEVTLDAGGTYGRRRGQPVCLEGCRRQRRGDRGQPDCRPAGGNACADAGGDRQRWRRLDRSGQRRDRGRRDVSVPRRLRASRLRRRTGPSSTKASSAASARTACNPTGSSPTAS